MGVKKDLKRRLGREPSGDEIRREKEARLEAEQPAPERVVLSIAVIASKKDVETGFMSYKRVKGPTSENDMLILHRGPSVVTTLQEVRAKATKSFPVGNGHGWQVFVGTDTKSLRFVGDQDTWVERFDILHAGNKLQTVSIFVREVTSRAKEATLLSDTRGSAAASDVLLQATPVELQAAAQAAERLQPTPPSGGGQASKKQNKKGVGKAVSKRARESPQQVEGEADELAETHVTHMRGLLQALLARVPKDESGDPLFVLTSGETDEDLSYLPFDPSGLMAVQLDDTGQLKPETLFLGCAAEVCKYRNGICRTTGLPKPVPPVKYQVKGDSRRTETKADGLVRLKAFKSIVGAHEHESAAAKAKEAKGAQKGAKADGPKEHKAAAAAAKEREVAAFKNVMLKATALAQQTPPHTAAPVIQRHTPAGLAQPEAPAADVIVLKLPFDCKQMLLVELTSTNLQDANIGGVMASDNVFEALREIERQQFEKQVEALLEDNTKADRVLITRVADFSTLLKRVNRYSLDVLKQKGGVFDRLCAKQFRLDDALSSFDLVSFGPAHGAHFSEVIWLPLAGRLFVLDSCPPCGHHKLTQKVHVTTPFPLNH